MIHHITGTITHKTETTLVLETNGIGYLIYVPQTVIQNDHNQDDECTLYIAHIVREDSETLYGFSSTNDRELFHTLTSVSGLGPKIGIKILSSISPQQLIQAILKEDLATLTSVSGVGKKMAERMILDLSDKLSQLGGMSIQSSPGQVQKPVINAEDDLVLAMKSLGYNKDEIKRAYLKAALEFQEEISIEQGIKVLLKHL